MYGITSDNGNAVPNILCKWNVQKNFWATFTAELGGKCPVKFLLH